ncbi:MAG TPA: carboxypeptidase-like regulatory domain-containing protein, partial [Polyangiaceae bacterium]
VEQGMIRGLARATTACRAGMLVVASAGVLGCPRKSDGPAPAPSASVSLPAPVASGVPLDPKTLSDAVNPDGKATYAGPSGTIEGRVVATGDAPVEQPQIAQQIPDNCRAARSFYAKPFREGEGRALADVLVSVIGYHEYIPAKEPAQRFVAKDCTFETRTIALTLGQRIEVVSGDREAYVPELIGGDRGTAQIVATPGGKVASTLYPTKPGRYVLIDNLRLFMTAEVYVLKYATVDVTGIDGRYRITGLPPGDLTLSAFLPSTGATVTRAVKIEADKTTTLDVEIAFDAAAHAAKQRGDAGAPLDAGSVPSSTPSASAPKTKAPPKPAVSAKP